MDGVFESDITPSDWYPCNTSSFWNISDIIILPDYDSSNTGPNT